MTAKDGFPDLPRSPLFSLGREMGCSCPTGLQVATAGLLGGHLEPTCTVHQADQIAAAERDREMRDDAAEIARAQDVYDRLRAPRAPATEPEPPRLSLIDGLREAIRSEGSSESEPSEAPALGTDALTDHLVAKLGGTDPNPREAA
jgi:hypothetical protein